MCASVGRCDVCGGQTGTAPLDTHGAGAGAAGLGRGPWDIQAAPWGTSGPTGIDLSIIIIVAAVCCAPTGGLAGSR